MGGLQNGLASKTSSNVDRTDIAFTEVLPTLSHSRNPNGLHAMIVSNGHETTPPAVRLDPGVWFKRICQAGEYAASFDKKVARRCGRAPERVGEQDEQ